MPRYVVTYESGFTVFDRKERRNVATVWRGGPADVSAQQVALRLARWLNKLDEVERAIENIYSEEEQ